MCSPVAISDQPEIPIEDILLQLKVKDLVRYKVVSRAWFALINSPRFINKHLLLHQSRRKTIFVTTNHPDEDGFQEILSLSPDGHEPPEFHDPPSGTRGIGIVGSCNGILCLLSEPDRKLLYLWNPSTREQARVCYIADDHVIGIGFGYDSSTSDYKAVKISSCEKIYYAEVWSMRTHGWRQIDSSSFPKHRLEDEYYRLNSSLFVGRNLYWLARSCITWRQSKISQDPVVISFDMADETFREIALPDAFISSSSSAATLVDFMGSLALLVLVGWTKKGKHLFDLWMMDENNTFATLIRIGPAGQLGGLSFPTVLCVDGNFLLPSEEKYIMHDPRRKEEYEIPGRVIYEGWNEFRIDYPCWSLVESLVSVQVEP